MSKKVNVNNIKATRQKLQLSQSQFAAKFNIPAYTLQCWEQGINNPTQYVSYMIDKIIELEAKIQELEGANESTS